ncbi:MAG TPA: tRNA pseudouridine(38-40) synthase TruA [Actinomycetota bacterium]|nr:tRNA pseudouridine(38-40) synthase TruA [Actinomycetota bacterium]
MEPVRVAMLLAYDGAGFRGFARQRERRTVQGEIERTVSLVARREILTTGAGRTDAGVHAAGQVMTFDAPASLDLTELAKRINKMLAPEISIKAVVAAPPGFDARFSARRRIYEYRIYGGPAPDPFLDRFALWEPRPLDVGAMNDAARHLVGEHDFASFCRANAKSLVRRIRIVRVRAARDSRTTIRVEGDSFCHQMVRSITGCLLAVGFGDRMPEWVGNVLRAKNRQAAADVAPARGLTLMRVVYRPDPFASR